ncbi:hypothetical protein LSCM4_05683 [Leishmania orientalis]|uniref:Paraflagellar rod protein 2C n=1 Tax=Leishmania orientalis TaxID=2249476 RepID=A0A836H0C0_9TRYP|nr:hypothetical protein LSCM4_05683 [Leishmania orientalis]
MAYPADSAANVPEVNDITLEAARKQKIHNLKLKTACLSNEEFIQDLHVSDWSETQKQKLAAAHDKASELLAAVEGGTKWALTEAYDVQKLMRVCGLEMSLRELYKPEDKPQFMEIVALKKTLNELKQHPNKTRTVSLTATIDNGAVKMEKAEEELRQSQLDASDLAKVPVPVLKSLEDCMNVTVVQNALQGNEEQIAAQLAAIEKACEIRDVAIADGEMAIAEEQYYIKAQLLEHLVELVADKFRIIGQTEDENKCFERIADTQKRAFQETAALKDAKRRLKGRCEDDLRSLHDAIQKADLEDAEALKRYATQKEKSEQLISENVERQDEAWRKIQELERALQRLGTERFEEVKRRIEENDREERRRVEYQQFLDVCGQHKKLLELTVYNCDLALRCTGMVEELVAESCSAIKARHDKTGEELAELRLQVHQEYLEAFRRLYKTLGQLAYKKEKRLEEIDRQIRTTHIQLEFAIETFDPNAKKHSDTKKDLYKLRAQVEEELEMLKDKMAQALEMFGPTEDALHQAGIEFVHPAEEVEDGNLNRRSKIVEYRAHLAKQEEVKIAAEREELKRSKVLRNGGRACRGELQRDQGAARQDGRGARGAAAAGAPGVPGGVPSAVQDAGAACVQEGEAAGGDRPPDPDDAHPAGVCYRDVRPEREEALGHEEGPVQAARAGGGGAGDAEGQDGAGAGDVRADGGRAAPGRHRVRAPCGGGRGRQPEPPQQDRGVPCASCEAGGGEDCRGARGAEALKSAAEPAVPRQDGAADHRVGRSCVRGCRGQTALQSDVPQMRLVKFCRLFLWRRNFPRSVVGVLYCQLLLLRGRC